VQERIHGILGVIEREIEWPTLTFFALLFIAVGAAVETGLIGTLSGALAGFIAWGRAAGGLSESGTLLFAALLVLWVSGVLSALIDNIPYVAVVIPIIRDLTGQLGPGSEVLWWALAMGACLGGNGSVIGATANVTVVGLAEKAGTRIGFGEFAAVGVRVMAMTLAIATVFVAGEVYAGARATHLAALAALAAAGTAAWLHRRWRAA
jgi:Na+/H+ antiporter NhaD/arsenite permease-like protein